MGSTPAADIAASPRSTCTRGDSSPATTGEKPWLRAAIQPVIERFTGTGSRPQASRKVKWARWGFLPARRWRRFHTPSWLMRR
jgi:hypothetical protein